MRKVNNQTWHRHRHRHREERPLWDAARLPAAGCWLLAAAAATWINIELCLLSVLPATCLAHHSACRLNAFYLANGLRRHPVPAGPHPSPSLFPPASPSLIVHYSVIRPAAGRPLPRYSLQGSMPYHPLSRSSTPSRSLSIQNRRVRTFRSRPHPHPLLRPLLHHLPSSPPARRRRARSLSLSLILMFCFALASMVPA